MLVNIVFSRLYLVRSNYCYAQLLASVVRLLSVTNSAVAKRYVVGVRDGSVGHGVDIGVSSTARVVKT